MGFRKLKIKDFFVSTLKNTAEAEIKCNRVAFCVRIDLID